jgi:hypothetical protein
MQNASSIEAPSRPGRLPFRPRRSLSQSFDDGEMAEAGAKINGSLTQFGRNG